MNKRSTTESKGIKMVRIKVSMDRNYLEILLPSMGHVIVVEELFHPDAKMSNENQSSRIFQEIIYLEKS